MAHGAFGRLNGGGHQFIGTLKGSKLGFGKSSTSKSHTAAAAPSPAFETPGMSAAARIAMPAK